MRLDKVICGAGWASRTEVKRYISAGRVTINGAAAQSPALDVDPAAADIRLDGLPIDYKPHYWLMLNKPAGLLSATTDPRQPTVLSLLDERYSRMKLFPVGRLDKDSTGLLLLTDDGRAAHRLLSPKHHVPKLYRLTVEGTPGRREAEAFAAGMTLADGETLKPAKLEIEESGPVSVCLVTLHEGKYHQLKRMFGVLGFPVLTLHRLEMGGLRLDESLKPGCWRRLTDDEEHCLLNQNNGSKIVHL